MTSSSSSSSSSPKTQRRDLRAHTDRGVTVTPPKLPVEPPPHIPAKGTENISFIYTFYFIAREREKKKTLYEQL